MIDLFKGYVPTKDKKCLKAFKNKSSNELNSLREVTNLSEYAGVLADNTVLIDVDEYEQSEILMNIVEDMQIRCRVYETSRGKHFLFLNNGRIDKNKTHSPLACGLVSDIKLGIRSSYEVLKFNGIDRKIIYDIFPDEEYECVPKWLLPISAKLSFLNMNEGDGRNQALFNYILTLQSNDFSVEESRQCLSIINKYILENPLDDDELNTIMRDDAFQKPVFFKDKNFLFDKFATYLKNNNHIIRIGGQLHIYDNGIYKPGNLAIESEMIKHIPTLNKSKRVEVMHYLDLLVNGDSKVAPTKYIAFKNGIYNLETDVLEEFTPGKVITNKIDFDYIPEAYHELTDKTLNKLACHDSSIRNLLDEVIGYCFFRRNELRKAFILTGGKRNGKSTFLDMLNFLLGKDNLSNLDLKELGDRFKTAELFGKLANIGDDIGDEFIANPAIFKKLVSGNPINVERKGSDPFDFFNYAKFLFSANKIPRIKDKTGAVIDRLIVIPFDAVFSADDPDFDPYIKDKLLTDEGMQYLITIGLKGLKRVLERRNFTTSDKIVKSIQEYEEENNPVLLFFKEIEENEIVYEQTKNVYRKYTEFCISNGFSPISNIEFSRMVCKIFSLKTAQRRKNGKRYSLFERKESENDKV